MSVMLPVIDTKRLRLRPPVAEDAAALHARRNDPAVAKFQNWTLPFPLERAEQMIAGELADRESEEVDGWRMLVVADLHTGETYGDLAIGMTWGGRCGEVGYSLDSEQWGKGYATEATEALIAHLFDELRVTRVMGTLHPDNKASARVLERCGLLFEGHTRLSFWVGDDNSDDHIYGMTRPEWEQWRDRPRHHPNEVALVEIGPETRNQVLALRTHKTQEALVAPMDVSFADALFPEVVAGHPVVPWLRSIVADGDIVGFVMMTAPTKHHAEPYLWRFLIDRLHQRRGIGARVVELLEEVCVAWGVDSFTVGWETGPGSPERFYLRSGFVPTGRLIDGEVEARKYAG